MNPSFDLIFARPTKKKDMVIFTCKEKDPFDFLMQLYDSLVRLNQYEREDDTAKGYGTYVLELAKIDQVLPGENIVYHQNVTESITYEDMLKSLMDTLISDIVGKIHLEETGEQTTTGEHNGSGTNRPDDAAVTEGNGTSPDSISCSSATEKGSTFKAGKEG